MRHFLLLLILTLLACCGRHSKPEPLAVDADLAARVNQKVSTYESLLPAHQDQHGFIMTSHCDATLFSGLLGAAIPGSVDLLAARGPDNRFYRRPLGTYPECYESGSSKSTISRDMFIGILWHLWVNRMSEDVRLLMTNARNNDYIMGSGDPSRISLMPNLTKLLAEMDYRLNGRDSDERYLPTIWTKGLVDYEAHLQVWQILLYGEVFGFIDGFQKARLLEHYERRPDNPLYAAAWARWISGNWNPALAALDNPRWPADRLPTSRDYSTDWWIQRDDPSDLLPDLEGPEIQHTGAEIVVIYNLIIRGHL